MVAQLIASITPQTSLERLESYRPRKPTIGSDRDMLVTYLYNLALCEALYIPLAFIEVSLRNTLHHNLSDFYGSPAWYKIPGVLQPYQAAEVAKAENKIASDSKVVTAPRVVSELKFGFWTSLLSKDYDGIWRVHWATLLKTSFPSVRRRDRQRNRIYFRYNQIRELRNRVFHHEAIWSRYTLEADHADLLDALHWINPDVERTCRLLDRFEQVLTGGRADIDRKLAEMRADP